MQQRRCFKPKPKVPLRITRYRDQPGALPLATPVDSRAVLDAAEAFLRRTASA